MKERIAWADRIKGLGILLIFCVHFFHVELGRSHLLVQLLSMSVLPPFYFASGYFCKGSFEWQHWLKRHSFSLLLPYLTASLGFWMLNFVQQDPNPMDRFLGIFLQLPDTPWEGGRWFIPSFFVAKLVFDFLASRFKDNYASLCLCCAGCAAAAWGYTWMGGPRLPWNIEAALFAQIFFAVGFGWKRYDAGEKYASLTAGKQYLIIFFASIAGLILALVNQKLGGRNMDYHERELNEIFSAYGASVCSLFLMIQFSMKESRMLEFIGRNSLTYCLYGSLSGAVTSRLISVLGLGHWFVRFLISIAGYIFMGIFISMVLNRWFPWAAGKQRKTQKTGS